MFMWFCIVYYIISLIHYLGYDCIYSILLILGLNYNTLNSYSIFKWNLVCDMFFVYLFNISNPYFAFYLDLYLVILDLMFL